MVTEQVFFNPHLGSSFNRLSAFLYVCLPLALSLYHSFPNSSFFHSAWCLYLFASVCVRVWPPLPRCTCVCLCVYLLVFVSAWGVCFYPKRLPVSTPLCVGQWIFDWLISNLINWLLLSFVNWLVWIVYLSASWYVCLIRTVCVHVGLLNLWVYYWLQFAQRCSLGTQSERPGIFHSVSLRGRII